MPPIRNISFIPKETDPTKVEAVPSDPLTALGFISLGIAVIFSLIGFGVTYYLEGKNIELRNNIQSIEMNLKNVPLDEMLAFYSKTQNINSVLKEHVYITTIFSVLENATEKDIYFKKFDLSFREGAGYELSISGISPDTRSMVRQIDTLKNIKYLQVFKSVELKNISKDKFENITFDIKINLNATIKNDAFDFASSTQNSTTIKTISTSTSTSISTSSDTTAATNSLIIIKNPL